MQSGSVLAALDDPFGFGPAPAAAGGAAAAGSVTFETKCPDGIVQSQVHRVLEAVLLGRSSL